MEYLQQSFNISYDYRVFFTQELFDPANRCFADYLEQVASKQYRKKLLFVIDNGFLQYHPALSAQISAYCATVPHFELVPEIITVPGGESMKNDEALFNSLIAAIDTYAIDRHSYVVAIGGGSLLDLVGYVAAIAHRGVKHIRIPTTVLSQNDSGVGVKNGINYKGKKNFLGTFAPPAAVFNDSNFLLTLEDRDWSAGISEAVKVALIRDRAFFDWLEENAAALAARNQEAMQVLVHRCAALHMEHIGRGGDPFESGSSRPLDFGHWSAHKLEPLTDFALRHGEAVAIGIALDSVYSTLIGWLPETDMNRIIRLLQQLHLPVYHPLLASTGDQPSPVIKGLEEFREHLGGRLTISLLRAVGKGEEVHHMDLALVAKAATMLQQVSDTQLTY